MNNLQPGILEQGANNGRFLIYNLKTNTTKVDFLEMLQSVFIDTHIIIGLGRNALELLEIDIANYREFPQLNARVAVPTTYGDLFVFIRDSEAGKVAIRFLQINKVLSQYLHLQLQVDGFKYLGTDKVNGHDLTGYEDGTENPQGEDAKSAVMGQDGSCFVAVQQWQHDLSKFNCFSQEKKDNTIGRRLVDNVELDNAPESSHVNRSDQGTFAINADILRRSMPWSNEHGEGLMFIAFCENLDRYEVQMRRMAGLEDGIIDALFSFSQVLNSAYFYCPAVLDDQLILAQAPSA
ncbi:Predicted dye-decolorizing peroxidase (DyP), YfeX-like subgroup [hydrothermal vent metagenome]|uniref:Predicted dye-decolorizing peroxidase (DyP), YfeX-like subgroup n=1 Tax=hydrothermal vent metagenome TaxID=652676 RepID=A0A3B0VGF9_9ZZZZ